MGLAERRFTSSGFSLIEIVVVLGITSISIGIVAGLFSQVAGLNRSTRQTSAVLEIRSKTSSMVRNLDSWLARMRSSVSTGEIYAACLPDSGAISSNFECPSVDGSILTNDSELQRLAGSQLKVVSAPIVDIMGEKIAGTEQDPMFFDVDSRPCVPNRQNNNCSFKSVGYFFRTNDDTKSNPGNVRFVVKLQPIRSLASSPPQRTQYFTIDVGSEWSVPSTGGGMCPVGSFKVGYLANGVPNCVKAQSATDIVCPPKSFLVGYGSDGVAQCKTIPPCEKGTLSMSASSGELECAQQSLCETGKVFLGYYSGSGKPICSDLQSSCKDGEVQIGLSLSSGSSFDSVCQKLPSCLDSQKLSYDGSEFVCKSATVASLCKAGEVVVGINTDGSAKCQIPVRAPANTVLCKDDEIMIGENEDGSPKCRTAPPVPSGTTRGYCSNNWGGMHETATTFAPAFFDHTVKDCGMSAPYPCHIGCSCPAGWTIVWTGMCGSGSCEGLVNSRFFFTCIKN